MSQRLTSAGSRWLRRVAAAFDSKHRHLKSAFVFVTLVPWSRRKHSQRVFACYHIAQLKRLAEFVIRFIGLIIQDDVNVIPLPGSRILVRHIAFEIAGER